MFLNEKDLIFPPMRVFAQIKYGNISKVYALIFTADESQFFGLPPSRASKVNTKITIEHHQLYLHSTEQEKDGNSSKSIYLKKWKSLFQP